MCEVNLVGLRLFDQRELSDCNGHGPSVLCVRSGPKCYTTYIRGCHTSSEIEEWENGEWGLHVSQHVVRIYALFNENVPQRASNGEKRKLCGKTFAPEVFFILHSSPVVDKNENLNLQRMDPSPFKESMPRPHSFED
jgi:hypothetical protein